ncbi:hypothetical protein [Streptomyces synnematoformans]|uniref:Uncharacterized protein n=1 Tax=Streptomyces synnematoformans TaxID=415721 RepID=A0ABN2XDI1_9ACTN
MRIAATSTEYVHVTVTAPDGADLSAATPRLAVLPLTTAANPAPGDWHTGAWEAGTTTARLLIGPDGGALTLTAGTYWVWIGFDPPGAENIVRRSGILTIH